MNVAPAPPLVEQPPTSQGAFDPEHPTLDALTGTASRRRFERALAEHDSDHATLVIIDIDHFGLIADDYGSDVADQVLTAAADRLLVECHRSHQVARIGADTFTVLFGDVDRATALQITKRLMAKLAEPIESTRGSLSITATAALSHQFGLVDTDELFDSATSALSSGKRTGRGRLFVSA
jgi:diguanylate cyclase (GGDEF)-like protein